MTDAELLARFEAATLDPACFHHAEHLRVAWSLLGREPFPAAAERFRDGLRRFAAVAGKPGLYHETITTAYLLLVNERRARSEAPHWQDFAAANPDLLAWKPSFLERWYRPETLSSDLARRVFLWPDRETRVPGRSRSTSPSARSKG